MGSPNLLTHVAMHHNDIRHADMLAADHNTTGTAPNVPDMPAAPTASPVVTHKTVWLFCAVFIACLLLFGLLGAILTQLLPFSDRVLTLHIVQNLSAIGSFVLPAWWWAHRVMQGHAVEFLMGRATYGEWTDEVRCQDLAKRSHRKITAYALSIAAFLSLIPCINFLTAWNTALLQPWQDTTLGRLFHQMSTQNEAVLNLFITRTNLMDFGLNLLTLALMPAICEEVFFRGCVQQIFLRQTTHASQAHKPHTSRLHLGIWLTAFLFSLMHFDPNGFLPRLLLGALLGYAFAFGGGLKTSILLHFLNNASIVAAYYLYGKHLLSLHPESFSAAGATPLWAAALGLGLSVGCIYLLQRRTSKCRTSKCRPPEQRRADHTSYTDRAEEP